MRSKLLSAFFSSCLSPALCLLAVSVFSPTPSSRAESADPAYFSPDYAVARARFRSQASSLKRRWPRAETRSFSVPSRSQSDLSVDYLYLPALRSPRRLVVLTSGVHGAEAFTGSAIQLLFLREFGPRLEREETGYLIVHSLNPFGFRNFRRATENNVNLNRNFSLTDDLYRTPNPGYLRLRTFLEPVGPVRHPLSSLLSTAVHVGSEVLLGQFTLQQFSESIGQGQYASPRGLEYGGEKPEPQVSDFLSHLARVVPSYRDIVLLDLHTGLGEAGQLHLMPGDAKGSVDPLLFATLFHPLEDAGVYRFTPNSTPGFYPTHGDLNNVLPALLKPGQRAAALTLEFGTLGNGPIPKLQTLNRLILENEGFHFGYASPTISARVRRDFEELFAPADEAWRAGALSRARELLRRMLTRMQRAS